MIDGESVQVDARGDGAPARVGSIPVDLLLSWRHASIGQSRHMATENVEDLKPHMRRFRQVELDACRGIERVRIVLGQGEAGGEEVLGVIVAGVTNGETVGTRGGWFYNPATGEVWANTNTDIQPTCKNPSGKLGECEW